MAMPPRYAVVAMREWAKEEMRAEACPPWTFYRLMQLLDALSVLEHGTGAVTPMDHLPEEADPANAQEPAGWPPATPPAGGWPEAAPPPANVLEGAT